jgi:hypothetical protein
MYSGAKYKTRHARLFYAARSHICKLYVCTVKMEQKFRRLCITIVIFIRASCEKFHKALHFAKKKDTTHLAYRHTEQKISYLRYLRPQHFFNVRLNIILLIRS